MGFMGSVIKITGKVAGKSAEYSIKVAGGAISLIAEATDHKEFAETSINFSTKLSEFVGGATETVGNGLGFAMDKAIDMASSAGGAVGGCIAEFSGKDEKQIQNAKMIGNVVGGAAIGLLTGDIIGTAVTGLTVAHGIASTGTAISALHGAAATSATIAHIGGGALSAGGGGIAAGHAILYGVDIATTVVGSIDGLSKKLSNDVKCLPRDSSKFVYENPKVQSIDGNSKEES